MVYREEAVLDYGCQVLSKLKKFDMTENTTNSSPYY